MIDCAISLIVVMATPVAAQQVHNVPFARGTTGATVNRTISGAVSRYRPDPPSCGEAQTDEVLTDRSDPQGDERNRSHRHAWRRRAQYTLPRWPRRFQRPGARFSATRHSEVSVIRVGTIEVHKIPDVLITGS